MEDNRPNYYAVIPAIVRYNENLTPNAKLLYGEVTALCNKEGYCWAKNSYFGNLYKVDERTIRRWLSDLVSEEVIVVKNDEKTGSRKIFLLLDPTYAKVTDWGVSDEVGEDKNVLGGGQNLQGGRTELSSTLINTTSSITKKGASRISLPDSDNTQDDVTYSNVDSETGEEMTHTKWGRPLNPGPKVKTEGRNEVALRIQRKFIELCEKNLDITPVKEMKGYVMALGAINKGGLTEAQVYDLFDEWFGLGKPDEETVQITRALSAHQINGYKARNQVK